MDQILPLSAFVNNFFFLEHGHINLFTFVYGWFYAILAELNSCDRGCMACKIIYSMAITKKKNCQSLFSPDQVDLGKKIIFQAIF